VLKKLLAKPVWWWERKRKYQIRSHYDKLPPIPVEAQVGRFVVLTTPECFCDALWAAWSWYRFVHDSFELEFVVDGEISKRDEKAAEGIFPGVRVFRAETIVSALRKSHPIFTSFFDQHPLGKKLGVILALQCERPLLFSDHDVLAFNFPSEITVGASGGSPLYITEEERGVFDSEIIQRAQRMGLEHAPNLNSGLLYVPKGRLSIALASKLLADWHPPMRSWFTEQTVLSVLLHQAGGLPLSRQKYVVSNRRQFYWEQDVDYSTISARHFTGTVRHIMYAKGMRFIISDSRIAFGRL
jgi:hypothetical protein